MIYTSYIIYIHIYIYIYIVNHTLPEYSFLVYVYIHQQSFLVYVPVHVTDIYLVCREGSGGGGGGTGRSSGRKCLLFHPLLSLVSHSVGALHIMVVRRTTATQVHWWAIKRYTSIYRSMCITGGHS